MGTVKTGLDMLLEEGCRTLRGLRVGLITNLTAVDCRLRPGIEVLADRPEVRLAAIFAPEHGLLGAIQAGDEVGDSRWGGLPVYSLYGPSRKPPGERLRGLDALVFDLPDAGARYYTFLYTMAYAMEAAAEAGIRFLVLDRPNPLNGITLDGNVLDPGYSSFVGLYPLPTRHGMTVGELARLFHGCFGVGNPPEVIAMQGWRREMWFDHTGLPWVPPSPNLNCLEALTLYPGTCLLEGTNLSEGRGTALPFQVAGAPWIDGRAWARELNHLALPGVIFRPAGFVPAFSKHAGAFCGGVQVHVTCREKLPGVEVGLHLIRTAMELWPGKLEWVPHRETGRPFIDLLAGTDGVRLALEQGRPVAEITAGWKDRLKAFVALREDYLLY